MGAGADRRRVHGAGGQPVAGGPVSRTVERVGRQSDAADAHMLADMVRTDSHQLRPVAGDSPEAEAIEVVARSHKTLIWERTRHGQRLRHALRDYFPAALEASLTCMPVTPWSYWPPPPILGRR